MTGLAAFYSHFDVQTRLLLTGHSHQAWPDVALDGHYLLVGPQNLVSQALALKRQGGGLGDDSPLVKALDTIGWKHGMVGGLVSGFIR